MKRYQIEVYSNDTERFERTADSATNRADAISECARIAEETQTSRRVVDTKSRETIYRADF